jgi:uncharacterized RDD family membrane protein YckC
MNHAETHALDTFAEVETPERVVFRHRIAGPVVRGFAYLLDLGLRLLLLGLLSQVLTMGSAPTHHAGSASTGLWLVVLFLMEWGYFVFFEAIWNGQSPGKRILGLRVIKDGGTPIGYIDSVLRNLLRTADFLPLLYFIGLLVMARDHRFRRLGDRVAGTLVVMETKPLLQPAVELSPPLTEDERARFPQRLRLSAPESDALASFIRRGPTLSPGREMELAAMAAPYFARKFSIHFPNQVRLLHILYVLSQSRAPAAIKGSPR